MNLVVVCILILAICSCGKKKDETAGFKVFDFTLTDVFRSVVAPALKSGTSNPTVSPENAMAQVKEKLFLQTGGESLSTILADFDAKLAKINSKTESLKKDASKPSCLSSEAMSRSILTPDDQAFGLYVQCYFSESTDVFSIFGVDTSNVAYFYERSGKTVSVAKVTKASENKFKVSAYFSVNYLAGQGSSGSILKMDMDQTTSTFQISFAGPNEICGVSLFNDSAKVMLKGSVSLSSQTDCPSEVEQVYSASEFVSSTGFDASKLYSSSLSFRRKVGTKISGSITMSYQAYGNSSVLGNVSLNQVTSPASAATDINFGPQVASELGGTEF